MKNDRNFQNMEIGRSLWTFTKKIPLVMRLFIFYLFCSIGMLQAVETYAQNARLSLNVEEETVANVLRQIEDASDFDFFYNNSHVDLNRRVSVSAQNSDIFAILKEIFEGTEVRYTVLDKKIILSTQLDASPQGVQQQGNVVKGKVVDANGEPVIGATIREVGTDNGTVTDVDGNFTIKTQADATLEVSFIGYKTQTLKAVTGKELAVKLMEDTEMLDEVVVVGYGTTNKQAITGSVIKADIDTYRDVPTNNIMETLKGSVPGLNIGGTNTAGAVAGFSIRGQNSTGGNDPLIVVDGAIFDGSLADLPSEDIEDLTVLKDASAAAVYGSRSANGVILITTKRGRSENGSPQFNVNLSYGYSHELNRKELYNAEGYIQKLLDCRIANGMEADPSKIAMYLQPIEAENYNATPDHKATLPDPYDLFRQTAYNMKANISISNSSKLASYYISASMTDQKGVVLYDRYKNFSGRINIDTNLTDWLKIGVKSNYSIRDYSGDSPSMYDVTGLSPYASLYDAAGKYIQYPQTTTSMESPFWLINTDDLEKYNTLGAILNAKITVPWVRGLSYEIVYSNNLRWSQRNYFLDENTKEGLKVHGKGERKNSNNYHMLLDNLIKYNNTFNNIHNIDITLLYSRERRTWNDMAAYAENFDNTILGDNKLQDGKTQKATTHAGQSGAIGMMTRATYTFDNKYSFTGTIRRDGCSAFSKNKKWGTFASGGFNWNLSKENFIKDIEPIDNLALRLSYGSNGNQSISPYTTLAKVGTDKYIFAGDLSYSITQGISSFALDNLGWETTTGFNAGIDFSLFENRLSGSIDTYFTNTKDLLFSLALPTISGKSSITSNLGKIQNKGVEISLHSLNISKKDFSWTTDFAFSLNRNKVASIYGEDNDGDGKEDDLISSGYFIGKSLGTIYGYKITGMWQQEDVDNGTIMEGMRPGDYKLEDLNGDGKIDSENDRQFLGTSKENFRWSMTNTLTYKDWSLMIYINSIWGGNGYFKSANSPFNDALTNREDINRTVYDYWTPEHTNAKYPRLDYNVNARYKGTLYQDRSFIKLQKIALAYNLSKYVQKIGINNMKLSLSADNLFEISPYWDGLDAETGAGATNTAQPSIRTYQMNLTFNF